MLFASYSLTLAAYLQVESACENILSLQYPDTLLMDLIDLAFGSNVSDGFRRKVSLCCIVCERLKTIQCITKHHSRILLFDFVTDRVIFISPDSAGRAE
jgi:hypothetical protein